MELTPFYQNAIWAPGDNSMAQATTGTLSRWALCMDGGFLALAGSGGLIADTLGHFLGIGPMAEGLGSPFSIGGFEAHGLAVILGSFMTYSSNGAQRRLWHALGMSVHLLLGAANLMFWSSFVQLQVVPMGIITTALHIAFVGTQAVCLSVVKPAAAAPGFGNPAERETN